MLTVSLQLTARECEASRVADCYRMAGCRKAQRKAGHGSPDTARLRQPDKFACNDPDAQAPIHQAPTITAVTASGRGVSPID
jgi:hypothetical protein